MPASSSLTRATAPVASKMLWFVYEHQSRNLHADTHKESFYKAQADVYDATRTRLLKGREDMLGLVAAQLKHRTEAGLISQRPVWVDVGAHIFLVMSLDTNNSRSVVEPDTSN